MLNPVEFSSLPHTLVFGSHKFLLFLNGVVPRTSPTPKLCFLRKCNRPTLSVQSNTSSPNQRSFTVSYLEDTCGFSHETALSLSKRVNLKNGKKPEYVLSFFRNYGFSDSQIRSVVKCSPRILLAEPRKSILPKFEFLQSKGISSSELVEMVTASPNILGRSLENHIIPTYEVIKNLLQSDERAVMWIKRWPSLISRENLKVNVQVLLDSDIPQLYVGKLLEKRPLLFLRKPSTFTDGVEKVKKFGFNPSNSIFVTAFTAINCIKGKWERKVEIFKKWGWTEDDVLVAFRKCPNMMMVSEGKIMAVMDFLLNHMGCDSKQIIRLPRVLEKSLEERIIPRSRVVLYLYSKGLIRKNASLVTPLVVSETYFLQHYIQRFEEEAPYLMNLYGKD